jgi:HEPN domain-containing protein
MDKQKTIEQLVKQWVRIAERDLLTAKQGFEGEVVVTDTLCFHCQQAVEKYLKAYLVKHQIDFTKTHNLMSLLNLCSTHDPTFQQELEEVDLLTDYAVELRYPDDWYEPTLAEAKHAYELALKVRNFVEQRLKGMPIKSPRTHPKKKS